ncbi:AbrB family transcriptional regulator [Pseudoponticoccus marisrubri]|uniref:Aminopeptidase n=1 Tax=Pseudoponticoccus marisrubri TaxID=1685382 RepID=A0A0W7WMF3_9RHOB|nr:AbrB family transcriptional regulator [Pseudoponticoccus marisrubri]KUF11772.1 aminopeptidase [Pseudoponticoccus marisrubri]
MQIDFPPARDIVLTGLIITLGAAGGAVAEQLGTPMPWMLGALFVSALLVTVIRPAPLDSYRFPMGFRTFFVGLIGVMIGTQVTAELVDLAAKLPLTIAALALFVVAAHAGNVAIFRRVGGYDRATAFYSGTPGGLMESIVLGEAAGADTRILTVQQFLRIILVIVLVPTGLSLWLGQPVGSAAGGVAATAPVDPGSLLLILATAALGLAGAQRIRLPAAQLTGPLLLAGLATMTGLLDLHLPGWMIAAAQVVIGVSLGLRFQGVDGALLRRSLGLSCLSVAFMLVLGGTFALILLPLTGIPFLHLFISFAPGGVTEMSVIALSLAANPALVSLHHVIRILMTVVELSLAARLFGLDSKAQDGAG